MSNSSKTVKPNVIIENLTNHERDQMTIGPSITTITWISGNDIDKATHQLRAKLFDMMKLNPWLGSRLKKNKTKDKTLVMEYHSIENDNDNTFDMDLYFNPSMRSGKKGKVPIIDSTMSYIDICDQVGTSVCEILVGTKLIDKNEPLLALSIIPDSKKKNTFAVIFSISHVIIDGFTYYTLLSMLSMDKTAVALNPTRKQGIEKHSELAMGKKEWKWSKSGALLCNIICTMFCSSKKPSVLNYNIDLNKIKMIKQREKEANTNAQAFVSTNDILSSTFGNCTNARCLLVPINFREKLSDFTPLDAGNYEGALIFGYDDYTSPNLIRKTINSGPPNYQRENMLKTPLPSGCSTMKCNISMITSWVFPTIFKELKINQECKQIIHMPHSDTKMIPFDLAVVYQATANQTAIAFFIRTCDGNTLKEMMPLGDLIVNADQFK